MAPLSTSRNRLAALNPATGSLLSWNPNADNIVYTLENADNTIYAGGAFTKIGNRNCAGLAQIGKASGNRIDLTIEVNGRINKILKQNDSLYLAGSFSGTGFKHNHLAKLSSGTSDATLNFPDVDGEVYATISDGNGGWYVGGSFNYIGDSLRYGIAHVLSNGNIDPSFNCGYQFSYSYGVQTMFKDGSTLYLGGSFSDCGNYYCPPRSYLASVDAATGNLLSWNPQPNGNVYSITKKDGYIYIGGSFTHVNGVYTSYLAKLDITSAIASSNIITPNSLVSKIQTNGDSLIVGGTFTNLSYKKNNLTAFTSGTDNPLSNFPECDGTINCAIPDGSNGWIVGGTFTSIGGQSRTSIARINSSGQVDPTWSVSLSNSSSTAHVYALTIIVTKLVIGGEFDQVNGVGGAGRTNITAVNLSNGTNTTWNNSVNGPVYALTSDGSASIYAGGSFTQAGSYARQNLAKFNSVGSTNNLWVKNANGVVRTLATLSLNTRILAGGDFTTIGSTTMPYIAKLSVTDNTNAPIATWQPEPNGPVYSIAISNDRIYLGGSFQYVFYSTNPVIRNFIACVDSSNGITAPRSFDPNANGVILQLNFDGPRLTACGYFTNIYGTGRQYACLIDTAGSGSLSSLKLEPNSYTNCFSKSGSALLMGGSFTALKDSPRNYLAAISTSSGSVSIWNPDLDGYVSDLSLSSNDLYVVGSFDHANNTSAPSTRFGAASWNLSTGNLNSWNPQLLYQSNGTAADLNSILYYNNAVYLGGNFDSSGIDARSFIMRSNTTTGTADAWNPEINCAVRTISAAGSDVLIGGCLHLHVTNHLVI
ncbi:MAG: delta-60 repeat domain-containing protein [Bacteroidetes bacterium]|nr:delta-60 repeat domain-containing protein [Bacteroidota bacterium]